ncbi:MAG: UDP-N-acetylmuramate dehydrogenase [Bacteroidetes bacterium]|nr:MAG: UDP-N-acetylmuramate dehydrogenase [Bacteroidota bacterium]
MQVHTNVSLKDFNTFGLDAKALYYAELQSTEQLHDFRKQKEWRDFPLLVLGGGSNLLFTEDFRGFVLRIATKGIEVVKETADSVYVKAMAGEGWENFVEYCVAQNWGGIENLTLIPGNLGTSPMQNIGAYGVELKDTFHSLEAWEIETGAIHTFYKADCRFGYRESVFKMEAKNKYIILSVCFRLTKNNHQILTGYGAVKEQLQLMGIESPGIKDVMTAIQHIRRTKLPDPKKLGNAGSFFKNPVIDEKKYQELSREFVAIPSWKTEAGGVKIPAAWLIERAGWKGYREGDAGVHQQQALVLVNYGKATGEEILSLSGKIQASVAELFGVHLEPEVNIAGKS